MQRILAILLFVLPSTALADDTQPPAPLPEVAWFNALETYDQLADAVVGNATDDEAAARLADLEVQTGTERPRDAS